MNIDDGGFSRPPAVQARGAITTHAEEFNLSKREVVERVVSILDDVEEELVRDELDRLEREGEVYLVGEGDSAEVHRT
ncbi:hypothetical protein [Halobacterium salinarum]|uniref:hypothetical protein n=1 Tax=Halobacterium salinarum TaxID=2242 RepID=UPI001F25967E|nr:hypothetical protein [Halobacterium salinarum]MCF2208621.1 hypothetical protein [Halobacterium salinarum]MDL0127099.1 hypothetical protein [Halobacterium salinarum]MDL0133565.1 hypothetical protein [Halobacterium salinarum]